MPGAFYDPEVAIAVERFSQLSNLERYAAGCFLIVVTAQIALPLAPAAAVPLVSATVVSLAAATVLIAASSWQSKKVISLSISIVGLSFAIEALAWRSGFPFGDYAYTADLQPQLAGVPLVVPFAWLAMGLPSWEIGRRLSSNPVVASVAGGWALMCWDLFLDPLMTDLGYWVWFEGEPAWQGIPLQNFAGWLIAGTLLSALARRVLEPAQPNAKLAWLYIWMTGFSALGFLLPIAFDRPIVGVVGLIALLPIYVSLVARWRARV